jgi:predicted DCC family thiol-disulfide oxidoreductase YuxK
VRRRRGGSEARSSAGRPRSPIVAGASERLLVLYDGDCGFCAWALAWILRWDRARRLRPLAIQSAEGQRVLAGMEPRLRLASWHAYDGRHTVSSGSEALPQLLVRLPGGAPLAALARRLPRLSAKAYGWVARNRTALSRPIPEASKRRARTLVAERMG